MLYMTYSMGLAHQIVISCESECIALAIFCELTGLGRVNVRIHEMVDLNQNLQIESCFPKAVCCYKVYGDAIGLETPCQRYFTRQEKLDRLLKA